MVERLRVEVSGEPKDRGAVVAAAREFVRSRGVPEAELATVTQVVEAMLAWAAERAYPNGSAGPTAVQLEVVEQGLDVLISDRGHPAADFGGSAGPVPAPLRSVGERTRGLRQVNLAALGTRLSAVIPIKRMRPSVPPPAAPAAPAVRLTPDEVEIRNGRPADAAGIVDLLFTAYGLSYAHAEFYRQEWIAEQIRTGRVLSTVGVFRGEVIAHHALLVTERGTAVESAVVVVHPAFRGLGIVSNHLEQVLARAAEAKAPAVFTRSVTHHPYSQMAEHALGFRTTALMMAASAYEDLPRSALTLAYLLLERRPHQVSFPTRYADPLADAYTNAGVEVAGGSAPAAPPDGPAVALNRSRLANLPGMRHLTVSAWNPKARSALRRALRDAVRGDVTVIHVDVDLETMGSADADDVVELLRTQDFFYCGLVLFGRHGHDHLRMQAILTDQVQVRGLALGSDATKRLFDVILADAGSRLDRTR